MIDEAVENSFEDWSRTLAKIIGEDASEKAAKYSEMMSVNAK